MKKWLRVLVEMTLEAVARALFMCFGAVACCVVALLMNHVGILSLRPDQIAHVLWMANWSVIIGVFCYLVIMTFTKPRGDKQ